MNGHCQAQAAFGFIFIGVPCNFIYDNSSLISSFMPSHISYTALQRIVAVAVWNIISKPNTNTNLPLPSFSINSQLEKVHFKLNTQMQCLHEAWSVQTRLNCDMTWLPKYVGSNAMLPCTMHWNKNFIFKTSCAPFWYPQSKKVTQVKDRQPKKGKWKVNQKRDKINAHQTNGNLISHNSQQTMDVFVQSVRSNFGLIFLNKLKPTCNVCGEHLSFSACQRVILSSPK
jgi:hypothetical protein